jgi:hypothetical protein
MEKADVRPDIDFYNMLIKKRSLRFDYENAHVSVCQKIKCCWTSWELQAQLKNSTLLLHRFVVLQIFYYYLLSGNHCFAPSTKVEVIINFSL